MISALLIVLALLAAPASAASRIKDLVDIEGVRENQLVGYGPVVGLNGTGDSLSKTPFTRQTCRRFWKGSASSTRASAYSSSSMD